MIDLALVLPVERCIAGQRFASKTACLGALARKAAAALGLSDKAVTEAIQHREALGSTGLGNGIALPHARIAELTRPFALMARLREPVAFDAVDDKPVDIVCLVLLPATASGEQLNLLAAIARRLREATTLAAIRRAKDAAALHAALATPG